MCSWSTGRAAQTLKESSRTRRRIRGSRLRFLRRRSPPHLAIELLKHSTGANLVHIPYKGIAPLTTDLVAGTVQCRSTGYSPRCPTPRRAASPARHRRRQALAAPAGGADFSEAGFPGLRAPAWWGFVVPAARRPGGRQAAQGPDRLVRGAGVPREAPHRQRLSPIGNTPAEYTALIKDTAELGASSSARRTCGSTERAAWGHRRRQRPALAAALAWRFGDRQWTWREAEVRVNRLASSLARSALVPGPRRHRRAELDPARRAPVRARQLGVVPSPWRRAPVARARVRAGRGGGQALVFASTPGSPADKGIRAIRFGDEMSPLSPKEAARPPRSASRRTRCAPPLHERHDGEAQGLHRHAPHPDGRRHVARGVLPSGEEGTRCVLPCRSPTASGSIPSQATASRGPRPAPRAPSPMPCWMLSSATASSAPAACPR